MAARAGSGARRTLGVVVPLALLAGAGWFYALAPTASTPTPAPTDTSTTSTTPDLAATSAPSGSATPGAAAPTSADGADGGGGTASGPGVTEPGIRLSATATSVGALEVSERVLLAADVTEIELGAPAIDDAGEQFGDLHPQATFVQLTVDGQPVPMSTIEITDARSVTLPAAARAYELRYVLDGSTVRSVPSTAGRALAALAPVSRPVDDALPVVVTTSGDGVRNLTCPRLAGDEVSCSDGVSSAMSVRRPVPWSDALVVLQLDLPRP